MNIEELKQEIESRTGVPASLLTGETAEENIAQAKALLAFRREQEPQRPKTTREQFSEWYRAVQGIEEQDAAGAALAQIEEAARVNAGGYPMLQDSGEVAVTADPRPNYEKFADFLHAQAAFNPFERRGTW